MTPRTIQPSHERRLRRRADQRAAERAISSTERRANHVHVADLMAPGTPRKRKRTAQPAQPSGDGHGLSGWSQSATLPYRLSATANDRRWDMTPKGSHR